MGRHSAPDDDEPTGEAPDDHPDRGFRRCRSLRETAGRHEPEDFATDPHAADPPPTPMLPPNRAIRIALPTIPSDFFDFDEFADDHPDDYPHREQPELDLPSAAVDTPDDFPDFPPRGQQPPTPPPPALAGGHRGGDDWRGGHRNDGGRRGVSIGVIAALVTVVVVVGVIILWRFFGDALSNRSIQRAMRRRKTAGCGHRRSVDRRPCAAFRGPVQRDRRTGR